MSSDMQIIDQIAMHATFSPVKPAFVLPDRLVTYGMLWSGMQSVQRQLADMGLDYDSPVGIVVDNPARHFIILLALLRNGFTSASLRPDQMVSAEANGVTTFITDAKLPVLPGIRTLWVDEKWFVDKRTATPAPMDWAPNRIARIVFTSGSTGRPKAIGYSRQTVAKVIADRYLTGIGAGERFMLLSGLSGSALFYIGRVLLSGGTVVFAPAEEALSMISTYCVDEVRGSASQVRALLERQREARMGLRVKLISTGGGPLSPALAERIALSFKSDVINTYSASECPQMGLAAGDVLNLRRERGNCFLPTALIEIVDGSGQPLGPNNEGLIRVRADAMGWPFSGALFETDEIRGDGWFYPGDVGSLDESGLLVVAGRADELINTGGAKFSPERIEEALGKHPDIADIAVAGMNGDHGVEIWAAVISRRPVLLGQLNAWIEDRFGGELGSIAMSRLVAVSAIPRTDRGKVSRHELRALLRSGPQ